MCIGFVGLGKMGLQIVKKLTAAGHEVVVFDVNALAVAAGTKEGAIAAESREDLVNKLGTDPVIWLMIPAALVEVEVQAYSQLLPAGGVLIDGGNSDYRDSRRRAGACQERHIQFMDVGTSAGLLGLAQGFSFMVGGDRAVYEKLEPIISVLAQPAGGQAYVGPSGYGHYVKMIHNGIEYGMMQAYAEGYDLLKYGPVPDVPLATVADVWQRGSIIASTLNELIGEVLRENPELQGVDGYVAESGEGEWTRDTAHAAQVPVPALEAALAVRAASREGKVYFATKLLAALRNKFGGHVINRQQ